MKQETEELIPNPEWLAIEKGDKDKAREMMLRYAGTFLIGETLSRDDRFRLAVALANYQGDPVGFFGHKRRGPSAKKTLLKYSVWEEVTAYKEQRRTEGKKQVDAYAAVAERLNMDERTVKDWYEEVQHVVKERAKYSASKDAGIAALLP